jgi:hypothetical protein
MVAAMVRQTGGEEGMIRDRVAGVTNFQVWDASSSDRQVELR